MTDSRYDSQVLQRQFPYRLLPADREFCEWLCNTADPFTEPFFDDSIARLRTEAVNQHPFKSVSALQMLPALAAAGGTHRSPSAIIFHVSRCGSTLFSQLLALEPGHMVLSEVPFFDALLRLPHQDTGVTPDTAAQLFDAALQLYIQANAVEPSHVFLKADSWHLHFYESLRHLFPGTPFILLYRDPLEVLQSHQRRRGMQSVPGLIEPGVFGFTPDQAATGNLDVYMAWVLETYFEKMIRIARRDAAAILINYNEDVSLGMEKIAGAGGIALNEHYLTAIRARAGRHGKYPGELFTEVPGRSEVPEYLQPANALYRQLDAMRINPAI